MGTKLKNWIKIIIGVLLLALLLFALLQNKSTSFNKVSFDDNNQIYNRTENLFLDTITHAGLHSLNIKNTAVLIAPIQITEIENDLELKGYITQTDGGYIIFIKNTDKQESITIISHELIHLNQLISKRLINRDSAIIFDNVKYNIKSIPEYNKRPWEIEAFSNQHILEGKIIDILYN